MRRPQREYPTDQPERSRQIITLGAALAFVLVLRVAYIQTVKAPKLAEEAAKRRYKVRVIVPRRGDVADRNGTPMAMTRDIRRITFDPERLPRARDGMGPDTDSAARTASLLASILGLRSSDVLHAILKGKEEFGPGEHARNRIIKDDVTVAEENAVRWFLNNKPYKDLLRGTVCSVWQERVYAGGDSSTALIGLTLPGAYGTTIGSHGLERFANTALAGSIGWLEARVDPNGVPIPSATATMVSVADGANVRLTVDLDVQRICAAALDQCVKEHTPEGATAIVLDPASGDVLGMVSRPSRDPSDRSPMDTSQTQLINRALELYEPGSVLKPITWCIALSAGVARTDEVFNCPGYIVVRGKRIGCEAHRSRTPAAGENVPRMVIAKSCNTATATVGMRLRGKRLAEGLRRFGLLDSTGIQLPGDRAGYLEGHMVGSQLGQGSVARIAFGQAIMASPLALTAAYGAIVNHGVLMRPRLIQSLRDAANRVIREVPVERVGQAVTPQVADEMASYLQTCVQKGTGVKAAVTGYITGGKTGTARKAKVRTRGYEGHIASFIGYIMAGKKPVVISVVVDEPHNGYHGSVAAAPTWQRIAQQLMLHWHIPPSAAPQGADVVLKTGEATGD
jgi:cell division protein FtsI/penicillin-binding protein 2